jgi:uncharacterized protein
MFGLKRFLKFWVYVIFVYTLIMCILYIFQEKIILHPTVLEANYQFEFKQEFKELNFWPEKNIKINALYFPSQKKPSKGLIMYHHGNSRNLKRWGREASYFTDNGFDVVFYDYRSFGKSLGKFEEAKVLSDALFLYDTLMKKYQPTKTVIFGRSLGTGVATYVAANRKSDALILETPYYSLPDVGRLHFPLLPYHLLVKYKFPTHRWIKSVRSPILIFHGTKDEVVPYKASEKLMKELDEKAKLVTLPGGKHRDLPGFDLYQSSLKLFLEGI